MYRVLFKILYYFKRRDITDHTLLINELVESLEGFLNKHNITYEDKGDYVYHIQKREFKYDIMFVYGIVDLFEGLLNIRDMYIENMMLNLEDLGYSLSCRDKDSRNIHKFIFMVLKSNYYYVIDLYFIVDMVLTNINMNREYKKEYCPLIVWDKYLNEDKKVNIVEAKYKDTGLVGYGYNKDQAIGSLIYNHWMY